MRIANMVLTGWNYLYLYSCYFLDWFLVIELKITRIKSGAVEALSTRTHAI